MSRTRDYTAAEALAENALNSLCTEAAALIGGGMAFGGRIWVIPRWYLLLKHKHPESIRLAWVEVGKRLVRRPTMIELATEFGFTDQKSNVRWTVGKGLLGYLSERTDGFDYVQHATAWPDDVAKMTEKEWSRLSEEVTRSRSLKDVQALQKMYGTAVGVSLAHPDSDTPIGCVTLHTEVGCPLTDEQADEVILKMFLKTPELARKIVSAAGLKLS